MSRGCVLALALVWACDGGPRRPERPARERPHALDTTPRPAARDAAAAARQRALNDLPRIGTCRDASLGGAPPAPGRDVDGQMPLEVQGGGECELLYPAGAFVRVFGPALGVVAPDLEPALLVGRGLVSVDVPGGASTPRSGFWLSTPSARIEVVQAGRYAVRVYPDGSSEILVVSGRARVDVPGDELASGDRAPALVAGQGLMTRTQGRAAPEDSPARLEDATSVLRARGEPAAQGVGEAARVLVTRLEQAVATLQDRQARLRELERRHRELAEQGDPQAMGLQQALAKEAALQFRDRREVQMRASTLQALATTRDAPSAAPLLDAVARARGFAR